MAWIAERKVNYRSDPKLKNVNPRTFKLYAVRCQKKARVRRGDRAIR
jgi:hypothetical protein